MLTGRAELHPNVTPEWLVAEGMSDQLVPGIGGLGTPR